MDASPTVDTSLPRPRMRWTLTRLVEFWGFALLVVLAAMFYLWWGLFYGAWLDNGVYAVAIVLLLFGLSGMWLAMPNPPAPPPPPTR
jgi:hypothetical protein